MNKSLPGHNHAATQHRMQGRFTSFLVFVGLFFSIVVAPAIAHASDIGPGHSNEMLDLREIDGADHKHSRDAGKDVPCHAVSHHHCSAAMPFNAPRVSGSGLSKSALVPPATTAPMTSRSQAPPLEPPLA